MERSIRAEIGEGGFSAGDLVRTVGVSGTGATEELARLLGIQARLGEASGAVVLRAAGDERVDVLAAWPEGLLRGATPGWVGRAAEALGGVLASGRTEVVGDESDGGGTVVVVSLAAVGERGAVGAFIVDSGGADGGRAAARLELGAAVIGLHGLRMELVRMGRRSGQLASAIEIGAGVSGERRFAGAAMALANGVASRFDADRVSVGMVGARRDAFVRVRAISHTERVHRKMDLVRSIESAMQECADQDEEVVFPGRGGVDVVARAAGELSARERGVEVVSLPLRDGAGVVGVVTLERGGDRAFELEELEALRLIGNVVGGRLSELEERDRWVGARAVLWARRGLGRLVGPEHTWAKVGVITAFALVVASLLVRGMETAQGSFTIEASGLRVVGAPFDGFVTGIEVEVGDVVIGGETVVATLDDSELRLELSQARSRVRALERSAAASRGRGRIAEGQIAESQVEEVEAGIRLLEHRIARARLVSPIDGVVMAGERASVVGAPVETGRVLFEIAPAGAMRVVVSAPEDRVADLAVGQVGWIAPAAYPDRRIGFSVERIEPVARAVDGGNVFRVYGALGERPEWLRPGMEGVARIEIGRSSLAWIWTRDLLEWVRMRVWL